MSHPCPEGITPQICQLLGHDHDDLTTPVPPSVPTAPADKDDISPQVRELLRRSPPADVTPARSGAGIAQFLPGPVQDVMQQITTLGGLVEAPRGGGLGEGVRHALESSQVPVDLIGGSFIDVFNQLRGRPTGGDPDPRSIVLRQRERDFLPRLASEIPTLGVGGLIGLGRRLGGKVIPKVLPKVGQ